MLIPHVKPGPFSLTGFDYGHIHDIMIALQHIWNSGIYLYKLQEYVIYIKNEAHFLFDCDLFAGQRNGMLPSLNAGFDQMNELQRQ